MNPLFIERYQSWLSKTTKNLQCSKGAEGKVLLSRFQCLVLNEDVMGVYKHSCILSKVIKEYLEEKNNLHWLEKVYQESEEWTSLFASAIRASEMNQDVVVKALVEGSIDLDFALSLL